MTQYAKMLHLAALTTAAAIFIIATSQASAQTRRNCGPRDAVVLKLAEAYGETRQSIGIASNNSMVEMFASTETGSWTLIATLPNGLSCLMASGQAFDRIETSAPPAGKGA